MSNPSPTGTQELSRERNKLWHVRQLFATYGVVKNRARRAVEVGVDAHVVERIFKRDGLTYQGIPKSEKLAEIARFIGCPFNEVYIAFTKDLYPEMEDCAEAVRVISLLATRMTSAKRRAFVELGKVVLAGTTDQNADVVRYAKSVVPLWETSTERVISGNAE